MCRFYYRIPEDIIFDYSKEELYIDVK